MFVDGDKKWFVVRVTYSRELKLQVLMQESGFQTFIPMCRRSFEKNGKKEQRVVPAISNLIFVHSTKPEIELFMLKMGESCPARFMWDKSTRQPVVVPSKAMDDFIKISLSMVDDIIYLQEVSAKLREGQRVKVKAGPFEGVEGTVIRVKRSRRVMVELPGSLAIATTFVNPEELEIL